MAITICKKDPENPKIHICSSWNSDNQCIESLDDALGKEDYYRLISLIIKILIILKKMV